MRKSRRPSNVRHARMISACEDAITILNGDIKLADAAALCIHLDMAVSTANEMYDELYYGSRSMGQVHRKREAPLPGEVESSERGN